MKKYFIAIAALAFLAACNGKTPQETRVSAEEGIAAIPVAEAGQEEGLQENAPVQKKYKGTLPAADGPGIVYDLTLFRQQEGGDGTFRLDLTYLEAENGQDKTFTYTGKHVVKKGTPADADAIVYELSPNDGDHSFYFQAEGDSLTLLNQQLEKAASGLNYTLKPVE